MILSYCTEDLDFSYCSNEMQFKCSFIKKARNKDIFHSFLVETEETVQGFPDVMYINKKTQKASFEEFKFTKTGKIKFQPSQPAFYRKYNTLDVAIIAYNAFTNKVHCILPVELFDEKSPYFMNDKAEVDLRKAEKLLREAEENESVNS